MLKFKLNRITVQITSMMNRKKCPITPMKGLQLIEEIFLAARKHTHKSGGIMLPILVDAYKAVLKRHGFDPAKDTKLYQLLVKIHKKSPEVGIKEMRLVFICCLRGLLLITS